MRQRLAIAQHELPSLNQYAGGRLGTARTTMLFVITAFTLVVTHDVPIPLELALDHIRMRED